MKSLEKMDQNRATEKDSGRYTQAKYIKSKGPVPAPTPNGIIPTDTDISETLAQNGVTFSDSGISETLGTNSVIPNDTDIIETVAPNGVMTIDSGISETRIPNDVMPNDTDITEALVPNGVMPNDSGISETRIPNGGMPNDTDITETVAPNGVMPIDSGISETRIPNGGMPNDTDITEALVPNGGMPNDADILSDPSNLPDERLLQNGNVIHIDDALSQLKFGLFHIKMLLLAGGGYFAVCSEILVFVFLSEPVKKEWNLTHYDFALLPFFSGLCGSAGGYVFGVVSDKFGRQIPFIVSIAICCVFGVTSALSPNFVLLVILRSLVSVGTGGLEAVDFVLLLEFLPKKNRGTYMVFITFCGALGAVLAGGIAWVVLPRFGWRWFVGACAVPSIIVFLLRFLVRTESPRYLMISGRKEQAMEVLRYIAAQNKTTLPEGEIVCPFAKRRGRIQDLFSPELRRRTIFMSLIWFFQSTGYWGVTIYLPEYMRSLGVDPYFNMFTIFVAELPGMALAMILVERHMLGRINSLKLFSIATVVSLLIFALVPIQSLKAAFVVVCYFSMVPIYSILNAYTPEIYPTDVRSTAMAWVNIVIEIPGLITPFVGALLLSSEIVWLYPLVWTVCFALQFVFSFFVGVETAGEDLRDKRGQEESQCPRETTRSMNDEYQCRTELSVN